VQAAAQNYFRKDVGDLTLGEAAMLAGLPPAPGRVTPVLDFAASKQRQRYVLDRMVEEGFVTAEQAKAAEAEKLHVYSEFEDLFNDRAPYFTEHVRRYVQERFGYDALNRDGLRVSMTVDADLQNLGQTALQEGLLALGERQGYTGPLKHLSPDEADAFLKKSETYYGGPTEIVPDRYYLGLVGQVDKERVKVRVGRVEGVVPLKGGMDWAAPYSDKDAWNNRRIDDAHKALQPGDVVLVRKYRGDRYKGEPQPVFALSQEPKVQGALVSLDPRTGYVVAMSGGFDYDQSEYNRAFQGCRQPGSVFKPIVYSLALDGDYTLATPLDNTPIAVYDAAHQFIWKPKNFEGDYAGDVILRTALVNSMNVPSIRVINHVGPDKAVAWAQHLGITTPLSPDPSLVLGASCVYPWDMVNVYSTFALRGLEPRTAFIKRIEDRDGNVLEDRTAYNDPWAPTGPKLDGMLRTLFEPRTRKINADTAYLMQTLLRQVVESGTGAPANKLGKPAGGKTGTTDAYDAWFVAFTESLVTGVWVGSDLNDRRLGSGETGGHAALPVWLDYMSKALAGVPQRDFLADPPPGVTMANIDYNTGLLAAPGRRSLSLPFKTGTVPSEHVQAAGSFDNRDLEQVEGRF
jgi:penicillin-binding protein 1A